MKRRLEPAPALAQDAEGVADVAAQPGQIGRWPLDEPFPALLTDADLRRVLGVGWTTFYRLKRLQRFRDLIADPVLTPTVRYSGFLVRAWVDGKRLPVKRVAVHTPKVTRGSFGTEGGACSR